MVASSIAVTVTFGATEPLASLTVPVIVPVTVCAGALEVKRNSNARVSLALDLDIVPPVKLGSILLCCQSIVKEPEIQCRRKMIMSYLRKVEMSY